MSSDAIVLWFVTWSSKQETLPFCQQLVSNTDSACTRASVFDAPNYRITLMSTVAVILTFFFKSELNNNQIVINGGARA